MTESSRTAEFIDKALSSGVPHDSVVGMLAARGFREKEIYAALAEHFRRVTGLDVPRSQGMTAGARDAFFYLLIFSTLAIWTCALGSLAFQLLDRWLADPLFYNMPPEFATQEIAWALSALLIAFPLYLLVSRIVLREAAANPEKLDSGVRKWLTYMVLVIAALVFMCDLITALDFLLRGELTSRFLAKAFIVLALSGGVFFYYLSGLGKENAATAKSARDRWMAILSTAVVALVVILGFTQMGSHTTQRELRADASRIRDLYRISSGISNYWQANEHKLPASTSLLTSEITTDPITHAPYDYHPGNSGIYSLCATFAVESQSVGRGIDAWAHPAGRHCFPLSATVSPQYPNLPVD